MSQAIQLAKVPRSVFDLSHTKKFSCELGLLYPVMCLPTIPGDVFSIGYESVFRASPQVCPVLHRMDVFYHAFYVAERILMDEDDYVNFITGGEDGDDATSLPTWNPSAAGKRNAGTLWDMLFGFQGVTPDSDSLPVDFPRRAYLEIFNQYYRDVAVEPEIDWSQAVGTNQDMDGVALPTGYNDDEDLQPTSWAKDYFTSCRPDQQLGDPVSLAIGSAAWDSSDFTGAIGGAKATFGSTSSDSRMLIESAGANGLANAEAFFNANTIGSVDISELRLAFQVQKWQELAMRAGVRYPEWHKAFFGENIRDERISRPEYIGGAKQPIVESEVQTNYADADSVAGDDPVGTLAGKGVSMNGNFLGKFRSPEFGWVLVLMSVVPKPAYHQGIRRYFTRRDRYDYYNPLFANLSEQAVLRRELYVNGTKGDNETIFGYAPIWDEFRVEMDTVHGLLAPGQAYDYWHMGRSFGAAPTLSASFIRAHDVNDDAWAVDEQPHFFVNHANIVKAVRPMPFISTPGNVDR